jgi:dUTP pyrophosphatase
MSLRVKLLREGSTAPERKSAGAAGYDLSACEAAVVLPGGWALVDTGVAIAVPPGTYGRIAPRSGLAVRGISVGAGVVDADYRGPVKVLLFNHSTSDPLAVEPGDRIAQLVLEAIVVPEVEVLQELPVAERGSSGFGSTGR